jgi:hypothetical protein
MSVYSNKALKTESPINETSSRMASRPEKVTEWYRDCALGLAVVQAGNVPHAHKADSR